VAVATLLVLAPLFALMPRRLVALRSPLFDLFATEFREIRRVRTTEFRGGGGIAGVLLLEPCRATCRDRRRLALVMQAYNPPVYARGRKPGTTVFRPVSAEHPDDERWPGLLMLRVEGRVFFANAQRVGDQICASSHRRALCCCSTAGDHGPRAHRLKMLGEAQKKLALSERPWARGMNPRFRGGPAIEA
jgi:hypothetical protein